MTQFHVTNSQVAHLWAHQSQEWAQGNGALSFRDKSICSYSAEIGRLHSRKRGRETLALMATCQWSVTTSRHQSIVNGACYNVHRTVRVPHLSGLGGDHTRNRRYFAEEIASARKKLKRARTYALLHVRDIERVAGDASAYSRFFRLRWRHMLPPDIEELRALAVRKEQQASDATLQREGETPEKRDKRVASAEILRGERLRVAALMGAERLAAWRSGARVNIPWGEPHRLRITRAGNVETSLGVVIPSAEAREAWPKLKFARQRGGLLYGPHNVSPGDIRLAGFRLDRMDDEGTVYAGCHRLAWSEIEAVGEQLTAMK